MSLKLKTPMSSKLQKIERPSTGDQLTLFLYIPNPGYALICFGSTARPRPFRGLVPKFYKAPRSSRFDLRFVACFMDTGSIDAAAYGVTNYPTYVLFKCGSDSREIGRFNAFELESEVSAEKLEKFVTETISGQSLTAETITHDDLVNRATRATVNKWLAYASRDNKSAFSLNDAGVASLRIGRTNFVVKINSGAQRTSLSLHAFVGKEQHRKDAALLAQVLRWNFSGSFLKGSKIGVHRNSSKFVVRTHFHLSRLNEVTFGNVMQNFAQIAATCEEKLQEYHTSREVKTSRLSVEELRKTRVSRFQQLDSINKKAGCAGCSSASISFHSNCYDKSEKILRKQGVAHREILRALIEKDRDERRLNQGRLQPKLGPNGFLPHGTVTDDDYLHRVRRQRNR